MVSTTYLRNCATYGYLTITLITPDCELLFCYVGNLALFNALRGGPGTSIRNTRIRFCGGSSLTSKICHIPLFWIFIHSHYRPRVSPRIIGSENWRLRGINTYPLIFFTSMEEKQYNSARLERIDCDIRHGFV